MTQVSKDHTRNVMLARANMIPYLSFKTLKNHTLSWKFNEYNEEWGVLSNGNRTEWSPVRSVIIRVINKIGRPRSGSPICLITSMITDRIGRHEVLLPINHNFNKICDIIRYFLNQNTRNLRFCFASSEKKSHLSARDGAYCPVT